MMKLEALFKITPDVRQSVPCEEIIDNTTLCGIEVEAEGIDIPRNSKKLPQFYKDLTFWSVKEDGSLRNGGKEFIFKQPLGGTDIVRALEQLEKKIKEHDINPDMTHRTSLHLHIDVRNMTIEELF